MNLDFNAKTNLLDRLEDLKDELVSIQVEAVVASMKDEDLKQAYNMLGHSMIAIDKAMESLENYKNITKEATE